MVPVTTSRARVIARTALAWLPFVGLWGIFNLVSFEVGPGAAFLGAVNGIGTAALLGAVVWRLTGRLPWPDRLRPGFYLTHLGLAVLFATVWLVLGGMTGAVLAGESLPAALRGLGRFAGWRLLSGVWLYGLIAGVAYAIRIREALRAEQQAALRAQALATEARLESLQARLNPHFFFNALHALSGLIHRDPARADDALDRIGQLLRRSLAADGTRLVPLAEEWSFTSDYLDLERLRLGSRLRVEAVIDEAVLACVVPPFVLQPLVENAVLHAVAPRTEGGTIRIAANGDEGRLRLTVEDDGSGAPAAGNGQGHGLDLLRRRLAAQYGPRAVLESGPVAGGYRASVELPAEIP